MKRSLLTGALIAAVLGFAFFQLSSVYDSAPWVLRFDDSVSVFIQSWRTPPLDFAMRLVTFTGDTASVIIATVALMSVLWLRGYRFRAWYAGVIAAVGGSLSTLFKGLLGRARPPVENALITLPESFSFPSGHTMASLCLGWVVGYLAARSSLPVATKVAVCVLSLGYVLGVAGSRVYLGVHWPSDVVASWLLGGAWIALATGVYESGRVSVRAGSEE